MYIGLSNIQELYADCKSKVVRSDLRYCLTGWVMLKNAPTPYNEHLLYVADEEDRLKDYELIPGMHILYGIPEGVDPSGVENEAPDTLNLLIVSYKDKNAFYHDLLTYFDTQCGMGQFCHTLLQILSFEGGIQAMVDHAYQVFGNPLFMFDSTFNLVAANWDHLENVAKGDEVIINKGFVDFDFKLANKDRNYERMMKSDMPIKIYHEELGYEQWLCAINTEKDMGHLVLSAVDNPFKPIDKDMLWVLKKFIDQQLKKDEFIRNSKGFHYEYFMKDLLDGKIATNKSFMERMNYVGAEFSGNMYCIVIEAARSSKAMNSYRIRNLFESRFANTKSLIYNGEIVILLSLPKNQMITDSQMNKAQQICLENGLYAGMSNCFDDITKLADYYKQALRAIELGICTADEPNLFVYEKYYLEHVKNIFMQKESSDTFCHPKMKILLDYDKEHKSELAYTFYMYLINERNIAAASAAMDMHRTSLVYRFKKINALIGEDFEDYKERQYMILSYEMNRPV